MNKNANPAFENSYNELCTLLAECSDKEFLVEFLNCLFTPTEREDLGKRWLLVKALDEGKTQRDIAKDFSMSLCRITRGSKELKKDGSAFKKMLEIVKNK